MSEERIKDWIVRQFKDKDADPSEMENWLLENSENPQFDTIMQELLDDVDYYDPVDSSRGYSLFRTKIKEYERRRRKENAMKVCHWFERAAAVLLVPAAIVMFYIGGRTSDVEWLEANTVAGQKLEILLPDGSDVKLGPSSKIIYPSSFGRKERKIFVLGSVYADIAKDPEHPFVINSGDVSVDVLGTTFNMKSFSDAECVEVILLEGSVRFNVLEDTHRNEMVMRPGNMLQYHRSSGKIDLDVFPKDKYSAFYKNRSLHFFNITLEDITEDLERLFCTKIVILNEDLAKKKYFACFGNNESLDEILNAINADKKIKIRKKEGVIYLK